MQSVIHPRDRQGENRPYDGEKPDHISNRPLGHEATKDKHAYQCHDAADERQHREKLLIEFEIVDHPPRGARTRPRNGAQRKHYCGSTDQRQPFIRFQLLHEPRHQEQHDRHGAGKHNLFPVWKASETDRQREGHEGHAPAEDPPIGFRRFRLRIAHIHHLSRLL